MKNPGKKWKIMLSWWVFLLVILSLNAAGVYGGTAKELFGEVASSNDLSLKPEKPHPTVIRSRQVTVNHDLIGGKDFPQGADTITLNLFADKSFTATKDRLIRRAAARYTWIGRIPAVELSSVIIVVENGEVVGNITMPGGVYQIRTLRAGVHSIREIDQSKFPPELDPIPAPATADQSLTAPSIQADDGSFIDIMVVYTPAVLAAVGSASALNALIELAIAETNTAYANSGIIQRLNLVHKAQVCYTESATMGIDLDRLTATSDGYMDEVHTLRDTYGADLVSLWVDRIDYCGMAWLMTSVSTGFAPNGFNVVDIDCATGYYSFGHELGHNMGARHDWFVDSATTPYPYAHGYVNVGAGWRTILAYNNACDPASCTRIQYFSNPSVSYLGAPTGLAGDPEPSDNQLTLDNTRTTVANFRSSTPPPPPPPPPTTITLTAPAEGAGFTGCSYYALPTFSWTTGETFTKIELQFSADNCFNPVAAKLKGTPGVNSLTLTKGVWKKVLKLPGPGGGTAYWRVVGTQADGTVIISNVQSLVIAAPAAVGSPTISPHTSKSTVPPPTLSWSNNCNRKFKAWFGNGADPLLWTKKKALAFNITDPNANGGDFTVALTLGQWQAIRNVAGDVAGFTIYWYVEGWDGVKRYSKTAGVMSFTLNP